MKSDWLSWWLFILGTESLADFGLASEELGGMYLPADGQERLQCPQPGTTNHPQVAQACGNVLVAVLLVVLFCEDEKSYVTWPLLFLKKKKRKKLWGRHEGPYQQSSGLLPPKENMPLTSAKTQPLTVITRNH